MIKNSINGTIQEESGSAIIMLIMAHPMVTCQLFITCNLLDIFHDKAIIMKTSFYHVVNYFQKSKDRFLITREKSLKI